MAFLQINLFSESLCQAVSINMILPENQDTKPFKTLWLLHGLSDDHSAWMRYTSVERYAKDYGIAVVMPCVNRSWYTDTVYGKKYFTFITKELPEKLACYFKGYSPAKEDNIIIGLSMGGYGAIKSALTYPEKYCFCASLSGALNVAERNRPCDMSEWQCIFGFGLQNACELKGTKHDLFELAKNETTFPYIYMWCGTEDFLLASNELFSNHLSNLGIEHTYKTSEGDHSWKWWDMHLQNALEYWHTNIEPLV